MLVKASVMPPPSGIKEAAFLVGANADLDKAEAEGRMVLGQPLGEDRHAWQATLPVPKDAAGKMIITVRFKSGVGLTGFASAMVAVRDHPVPNHAGAPGAGP